MEKKADKYLKVDSWKIIEEGFHPEYALISESVFSLANEYMGVRGYLEEGYGGERLQGSYFNGVYERKEQGSEGYKGIVHTTEYMVNALDWLNASIYAGDEKLDLFSSKVTDFVRELDMKTGVLKRSFCWVLAGGEKINVEMKRLISMEKIQLAAQTMKFTSVDYRGEITVSTGLDFNVIHQSAGGCMWDVHFLNGNAEKLHIYGTTKQTKWGLFGSCKFVTDLEEKEEANISQDKMSVLNTYCATMQPGKSKEIEKIICNQTISPKNRTTDRKQMEKTAEKLLEENDFASLYDANQKWWGAIWKKSDITIDGDEQNQQGIRFCIFQMFQTYHGAVEGTNIGAKGLTGEAYNGNAFWDTETYCLPFYLFHDKESARNLLYFRYKTLEEAKKRAADLDCKGAFYPIATISGKECCNLWQHASLQLQASTGVAYGIWLYEKILQDREFVEQYGLEMLIEISRMLASRGDYNSDGTRYGYYCVMGPDEFQMMVNHNCYTNYMGKFTFYYTLDTLKRVREENPKAYQKVTDKTGFKEEESRTWKDMADKMYIPRGKKNKLYEQHEGYFELPQIDIHSIPMEEFPLYHHWSYDRIYRNNMIKQPDVLMFMLLFNSFFTEEEIRENYEFYEPHCIHESSLSPSVHSIFASQLKKHKEAFSFFEFATRMDLDNYNRNSNEGLHTTSIAAAWMNIVYGFGGMRCDGDGLSFHPSIPKEWNGYSFRIVYKEDVIVLKVTKEEIELYTLKGQEIPVYIYDTEMILGKEPKKVAVPVEWKG